MTTSPSPLSDPESTPAESFGAGPAPHEAYPAPDEASFEQLEFEPAPVGFVPAPVELAPVPPAPDLIPAVPASIPVAPDLTPVAPDPIPAVLDPTPLALAPVRVEVPPKSIAMPVEAPIEVPIETRIAPAAKAKGRLVSLDALRGFDMLWIIGLDGIVEGLQVLNKSGHLGPLAKGIGFVNTQLTHRDWEGLAFEDLIFPLFVFIVGVSIVFSLTKALANRPMKWVVARIVFRTALLYLFGVMIYHGFDQPIHGFAGQTNRVHAVRWLGVLQRIALCYGAAGLLFCFLRARSLALITLVLLVGYWLLMSYVNVPGVGRGSYAEGKNLANYLDQRFLGGFKWDGDHDPEGYLSTLPAIATCLLGVFAGLVLRSVEAKPWLKFVALFFGGAALAGVGYAWGFLPSPVHMPVIKKLWTSSYVLLAGGYSAMMLALFYLVIDVWGLRSWAAPFTWVGSNAIALYMVAELGGFNTVAHRLVGGGAYTLPILGDGQQLVASVVALALVLVLARFLYRRGVFIRV